MSTSTDGGLTWSAPIATAGNDKGLGGQPVVQPNGTVVVPFESLNGTIAAFHSDHGGASWRKACKVSDVRFHRRAGGLRTSPLPSAEVAGDGTVYVAWEDCRFRSAARATTSSSRSSADGVELERRPADPDRRRHEHRRSLHPRPRRRPGDLRRRRRTSR